MYSHKMPTTTDNTPSPLSAIIWDMGGIMYRFFTELMVEIGNDRDWPLNRLPLGPTGPGPDPYYSSMDRGEMTEPEYVTRLVEVLASEGITFSPYADLDFSRGERPEIWPVIERLHANGWKQALLTNDATAWLGERWWETWPYASLFEAVVDVKTVGVRKPAPEPYLACAEALDSAPATCIFIDDMRANCRGAEQVGMQSYWFDITDPKSSVEKLLQLLDRPHINSC